MKKTFTIILVALAATLASCTRKPYFSKNVEGSSYVRSYRWGYDGHPFALTLRIPIATYLYYDTIPKYLPYSAYAVEDPRCIYMQHVVSELYRISAMYHFDARQNAEYVLAFCQSMPYESDPPGDPEWVRWPVETLMDCSGRDCEDASILCCAILSQMGYHTALLHLADHPHMAAGVEIEGYSYVGYDGAAGHHYAYAECTGAGWLLGECPYPHARARVYEVEPVLTAKRTFNFQTPKCGGYEK